MNKDDDYWRMTCQGMSECKEMEIFANIKDKTQDHRNCSVQK